MRKNRAVQESQTLRPASRSRGGVALSLQDFAHRQDAARYIRNSITTPDRCPRSVSFPSGTHIYWYVYDADALAFSYAVEKPGQRTVTREFQRRGERAFINALADALVDGYKGI